MPAKLAKYVNRIERLDSIRFLAALWVAISHEAIPLKPLATEPTTKLILAGVQSTFSGTAAVMVFFIVSGLCIHLPYSGGKKVPILHFLIRRYVRVGLPLLAIIVVAQLLGSRSQDNLAAVAWSVYAELFYYSIYPLMFWLAQRVGWTPLISCSLLLSISVSIAHGNETVLPSLGWMAWFWGLPVWLLGCLLADHVRERRSPPPAFLRRSGPGGYLLGYAACSSSGWQIDRRSRSAILIRCWRSRCWPTVGC